ncbi:MAG: hypothetical protein C6W56_12990 [Caldibacillus debilis]|nr:MAG: hypothetical protein C6W56_12990 [Caldibacillus debilis]
MKLSGPPDRPRKRKNVRWNRFGIGGSSGHKGGVFFISEVFRVGLTDADEWHRILICPKGTDSQKLRKKKGHAFLL